MEAADLPPELASEGASSDDGLFLEAMGAMGESFSSSSSAAMGAEETMSAWGGGLGGLLRFRSALVLSWLRLFIFLLPELRCAGGGQFSLFSSATEKDAAAADEGGSLGAAESLSATYSISNRLWLELFDLIYKGGRFAIFENR